MSDQGAGVIPVTGAEFVLFQNEEGAWIGVGTTAAIAALAGAVSLDNAIIKDPATSARNVIEGVGDVTELTLVPSAGQTEPSEIINSDAAQNDIRLVKWPGGSDMEVIKVIGADGVKWYLGSLSASTRFELFAGDGSGFPEAFLNLVVNGSTYARFDAYQDTDPVNSFMTLTMKAQLGQVLPIVDLRNESDVPVVRVLPSGAIGTSAEEPADADINPGECFCYFIPTNGAAQTGFKGKTLDGTVVKREDAIAP